MKFNKMKSYSCYILFPSTSRAASSIVNRLKFSKRLTRRASRLSGRKPVTSGEYLLKLFSSRRAALSMLYSLFVEILYSTVLALCSVSIDAPF